MGVRSKDLPLTTCRSRPQSFCVAHSIPRGKLYLENARLNRVESAVVTLNVMVVLSRLTMISNHPHFGCNLRIIRCGCSTFTAGSKILAGVETESRGMSDRSGFDPSVQSSGKIAGAVRLAGVLHKHKTVLFAELHNWIQVNHLPIEMDWNRCGHRPLIFTAQNLPCSVLYALLFQISAQCCNRHVIGRRVDIDKLRRSSSLRDRFAGRNKCMWHRHDDITWFYSAGH